MTEKSSTVVIGESEEQLRAPFEALMKSAAIELGKEIVCVGETLLQDRIGKPDFGIVKDGLLIGYAELKAPGKGVVRSNYKGHDLKQFDRFVQLPNVLYTDGNRWALYRFGKRDSKIVRMKGNVAEDGQSAVTERTANDLLRLLSDFVDWQPVIPTNPRGEVNLREFAKQLAPLCKFLRDDVQEEMSDDNSSLHDIAARWRELLFPNASDAQFADAYAQTVTFALLLARIQGAGSETGQNLTFDNARSTLSRDHNLLSTALVALADEEMQRKLSAGLNSLLRLISAVPVGAFSTDVDPWLYFYEDFLAEYDAKLRKNSGVYYTPLQVVRTQVRLVEDLLVNRLGKTQGFADDGVVTLDPATGTGTYLLGVIEHSLRRVSNLYGEGTITGHARQLANNLYGFELMVGPYAVADLRVTETLRKYSPELSDIAARIYLTDTLESPERQPPQGGFFVERALAQQQEAALHVKKNVDVLVCIGNPPYDRAPAVDASGGWVRHGEDDTGDRPILNDFLESAQAAGLGVHLKNLYNLYVYFWRWALWKVFEQDTASGPGVVSFITASSYLDGNAFAGMREHMRRVCDEIWILDIGGEARGPRKSENVFDIQIPVAIAVAYRTQHSVSREPAKVRYTRIEGNRQEKLAKLEAITDFSDVEWRDCPDAWQAPFMPAGIGKYFDWPLLTDLMPWQHSGVQVKRTWPISADKNTLERRWNGLLQANDRAVAFREDRDRKINRSYNVQLVSQHDSTAIADLEVNAPIPPIHRYAFRFLDRQHIFADGRIISFARPDIWHTHSTHQIYLMGRLTQLLGEGPALISSALPPDLHHLAGGGKDVIPLYRTSNASEANITPRLLDLLGEEYGFEVTPPEFAAYLYGVMAQPYFTKCYYAELATREVRLPLTKDSRLFRQVRDIGARLLWLHTYGERYILDGFQRGQIPQGEARCNVAVPSTQDDFPESFEYDSVNNVLRVGNGQFAPVAKEVYEFQVSGLKVVQSWLKYRMRDGSGRKSSPLDEIRPTEWPPSFTTELLELLWVLEATVDVQSEQAQLLDALVSGRLFEFTELPEVPDYMRKPPRRQAASVRLIDDDLVLNQTHPDMPDGLSDALNDLHEASNEAHEEGFPVPSELVLSNAERLLNVMYRISPRRFEVYPTPDGEIAIDAPTGTGQSVLLLCKPDGGALCLANLLDGHTHNAYTNADALPDDFLRRALVVLEQGDD